MDLKDLRVNGGRLQSTLEEMAKIGNFRWIICKPKNFTSKTIK